MVDHIYPRVVSRKNHFVTGEMICLQIKIVTDTYRNIPNPKHVVLMEQKNE